MHDVAQQLALQRIVPVVRLNDLSSAEPLQLALIDGGLPIAEVTLRTDCAIRSIEHMSRRDDFLVGAGTVLNARQCEQAVLAGARFIVSPGYDQSVVDCCKMHSVPSFPGVATATEIQRAWNAGVRTAKFFPAENLGGVAMLRALAGPFQEMQFIPTGGIGPDNAADYLGLPCVAAIGGSWMVKPDLYKEGDFERVSQLARQAMLIARTSSK